jgi:uncharacterized membrane protein YvlD (DUF360 family)
MHLLAQFIAIILGLFLASQSVGGFVVGTFGQVIAIALLLFVSQRTIKPAITVLTLAVYGNFVRALYHRYQWFFGVVSGKASWRIFSHEFRCCHL